MTKLNEEKKIFNEKVEDYELYLIKKREVNEQMKKLKLVHLSLQNKKKVFDEEKNKFLKEKEEFSMMVETERKEIELFELSIDDYLNSKLD